MLLSKENYTRRLQVLLIAASCSAATLILHTLGLAMYLYWVFRWFDILVHTLGGLAVGFLAAFLFSRRHIAAVFAVLFLSVIGWEVFEVVFVGIEAGGFHHAADTVTDVAVSLAAGCVAVYLCAVRR